MNFSLDKNIFNKIASLIEPDQCDMVIEIGPGLGGLSESLIELGAKKILLIEKDKLGINKFEQLFKLKLVR